VARPEILHGTLDALRADDSIDVWLVFGRPIVDRYSPALIEFARTSGKAVVVCCGVPLEAAVHRALRDGGIAVLEDPELCLQALGRIQRAGIGAKPRGRDEQRHAGYGKPLGSQTVHAAIENDREFGPILTLTTAATRGRIVRALPASSEHLRDAAHELAAADIGLADATERIAASLHALVESTPPGAEASIDLPLRS
jgi:hypothetical protein